MADNLIEVASSWLQKDDDSKSIQVRTAGVISRFLKYTKSLEDSFFEELGATKNDVEGIIKYVSDHLDSLLNRYLNGNIVDAIWFSYQLLAKIPLTKVEEGSIFYRARPNDTGFLYKKGEMFHIPYEYRYKIANQRYSVSGLPCLYLGSSTYLCWEELERPDYQKCNYCALKNVKPIWVFDLRIPSRLSSINDVYRVCLALACSLKTRKEHTFKLEYIVPQCLLHAITSQPSLSHDGVGICYYSVQCLTQESSPFIVDYDLEEIMSRYYNIVIPAQNPKKKGLSGKLTKMFIQSPSMSMMYRHLMNSKSPKKYLNTIDNYGDTLFGELEDYLRFMLKATEVEMKKNKEVDW